MWRSTGYFLRSLTTKIIGNQPELFERYFDVIDEFKLGMVPDTISFVRS